MDEVENRQIAQYDDQEETSARKIILVEERLKIDVRQVETGTVQISKKVISEEVTQQVPVLSEEIVINHKPINQYIENIPAVRVEGDTTIISVVKEVLVVEKRLMLVEEIHLTKTKTEKMATVTETLQKDVVDVTRTGLVNKNTTDQ